MTSERAHANRAQKPAVSHDFEAAGTHWQAQPSGALWAPEPRLLCVADLHLGKSERMARRGGPFLPPYETEATLTALAAEVERFAPRTVLCLGDSFDDPRAAAHVEAQHSDTLARLMAGRRWVWMTGNHDPVPNGLGGDSASEFRLGAALFRHIAVPHWSPGTGADTLEVSGHYHPKATLHVRGRRLSRRCFVMGAGRLILPAFGAYTGGLDAADPVFAPLVGEEAVAFLLGAEVRALPRRVLSAPNALARS
ncbi:MAG: ligase-associated DNA damage response endonuclease PdeM [Pseudomonadota bacterium]